MVKLLNLQGYYACISACHILRHSQLISSHVVTFILFDSDIMNGLSI